MAIGSVIGGVVGGIAGSYIPGAGTAIGMGIGSGIGGIIEGEIGKAKADNMKIPTTDPMQLQQLADLEKTKAELKAKQRMLELGTMYQPQQQEIRRAGNEAINKAITMTGGNIGATLAAINVVNRSTGRNLGGLYSDMSSQANQMSLEGLRVQQLMGQSRDSIAARKLRLGIIDKQQAMEESYTNAKEGQQNMMAAIAAMAGKGNVDTNNTTPVNTSIANLNSPLQPATPTAQPSWVTANPATQYPYIFNSYNPIAAPINNPNSNSFYPPSALPTWNTNNPLNLYNQNNP
jgi:hypothetical protein